MRVAHIITRLILGGAQENTVLTCEDLIHIHGDDVLLITGPPLGPEGSLLERARAGGVPVKIIPSLRRAIHPIRDCQAYLALRRAIREFGPDVVHTHSAKAGLLGRYAAWNLGTQSIVHTIHGAPFHPYQSTIAREFFRRCERAATRKCHSIISVADAMTSLMVRANVVTEDKCTTVLSGMGVEPFLTANEHRESMRKQLGYAQQQCVIGMIARLFYLKGHADLVAAAKRVVREAPQVRFLLVGDGKLRSDIECKIRKAGLRDYFQFTGLVPQEDIPTLIGAMDIVVHTSLREGLARVLPQALIAGKPVVSYDIDGAREVVITGETGFLVPPRGLEQLSTSILSLVTNPQERTRLGEQGRSRFTEAFRHENMTKQIRSIYASLLR